MIKPLLLAVALAALLLAACGDEETPARQTPAAETPAASPTPTRKPGGAGGLPAEPTLALPTPAPTTAPVPPDWLTYADPVLGFSLRYPPDLAVRDLTPKPGTGSYERVLDFHSAADPRRAFSIEVLSNPDNLSPRDWALQETACLPATIQEGIVAGITTVTCTEEAGEIPNALVVFEHVGRVYEIGSVLTSAEFDSLLASIRP